MYCFFFFTEILVHKKFNEKNVRIEGKDYNTKITVFKKTNSNSSVYKRLLHNGTKLASNPVMTYHFIMSDGSTNRTKTQSYPSLLSGGGQ